MFIVLPYPRGSTFDWAWLLMSAYIYVLAAFWLFYYSRGMAELTRALHAARPVLYLLILWLLWHFVQLIPMPIELLAWFAPLSADIYQYTHPEIQAAPISVTTEATTEQLIKSIAYVVLFILILLLVDTPQRLRIMARWLVGLAVIQAVIANLLYFADIDIFYESYSALGTFANRNQLAGYLQLNLAIGIGLLLADMREHGSSSWREWMRRSANTLLSRKVRLRIYLAIMVITLVLTHSRMGNTAFFVSMTVTGILALLLMKHSPRPVVILLTSLIIIDLFIVSKWFGLEQLQQRFVQMQQETVSLDIKTNTLNRLDTTMHANTLKDDAGWSGTGAGSFYAVFPAYQGRQQPGYFQHAHNDYMEFLTDTGYIGITLLGGIVLITIVTGLVAMRSRRYPLMRGMAFTSVMGILSLMIHSATDFNLRIPANATLFIVILAFAFISHSMPVRQSK